MNQTLIVSARHNYAALFDLAKMIEARGYWGRFEPIESSVADTVAHLFDTIAWADRKLHRSECQILDALMEEDEALGGRFTLIYSMVAENPDFENQIPDTIERAIAMDREIGCRIAPLLANHLENLASLILQADGNQDPMEIRKFQSFRSILHQTIEGSLSPA